MSWLLKFEVSGVGPFPVDMLRYDCCYPQTTEDALAIVSKDKGASHNIGLCLIASTQVKPTKARWESFGWTVDEPKFGFIWKRV